MQHEAWVTQGGTAEGMMWIIVARARGSDDYAVGAFLIDAWCLGVKDAYTDEMSRAELEELLDEQMAEVGREVMEPACAKKLIDGAVAFAQGLGFLPHRDFRKARKVLNGLDAATCAREFAFGHDGRVHFVAGPADDEMRVRRVLAVLDAKFGPEGFDFTPYAEEMAEEKFDWEAIDTFFKFVDSPHCPDHTLAGQVVPGFLTAAVMLEPGREIDAWWRELFGGQTVEPPDANGFTAERVLDGFVELWSNMEGLLDLGEFAPALPPIEESNHFVAAAQFCRGFLRVLEARPAIGEKLAEVPAAAEALAELRRIAALPPEGPSATARRAITPVIAQALEKLWDATEDLRPVREEDDED